MAKRLTMLLVVRCVETTSHISLSTENAKDSYARKPERPQASSLRHVISEILVRMSLTSRLLLLAVQPLCLLSVL